MCQSAENGPRASMARRAIGESADPVWACGGDGTGTAVTTGLAGVGLGAEGTDKASLVERREPDLRVTHRHPRTGTAGRGADPRGRRPRPRGLRGAHHRLRL